MKKLIFSLILASVLFGSCLKPSDKCSQTEVVITAPAGEIANVQAYLTANSIVATQHSSGFFYIITNAGTGTAIANLCSTVSVKYVGKLTNGTIFDQTPAGQTSNFQLGGVIFGWQKSLPLINVGGVIRLFIPPTLGYGANPVRDASGAIVIPANSILIFDVELIGVTNL